MLEKQAATILVWGRSGMAIDAAVDYIQYSIYSA